MTLVPVAFTRDSKYMFVCNNKLVNVYSVSTGTKVRVLRGHTDHVTGVALSPRNPYQVYSVSLDGTVRLWNFNDGVMIWAYQVNAPIRMFCFHPVTHIMYFLVRKKRVTKVFSFDPQSEILSQIFKKRMIINRIAIDSTGDFLFSLTERAVSIYSIKTAPSLQEEYQNIKEITAFAVHPNEKYFVVGDVSGQIHKYHYDSASKERTTFKQWHFKPIGDILFDEDGIKMISAGGEAALVCLILKSGSMDIIKQVSDAAIVGISQSPNSDYYALRTENNRIVIFDVRRRQVHRQIFGICDMTSVSYHPSLPLVSLNTMHSIQLFDLIRDEQRMDVPVSKVLSTFKIGDYATVEAPITAYAISKDGGWLVTIDEKATGDKECSLKFWKYDSAMGKYFLNTQADMPHKKSKVVALALHPKQHFCVTGSKDGYFKFWKVEHNPTLRWSCQSTGYYRESYPVNVADFSPDGSMVALACRHIITLWNPSNNSLLKTLAYPMKENIIGLHHISMAKDTWFLIAYSSTNIYVWNILRCELEWTAPFNVLALTVDPLNPRFAFLSPVENHSQLLVVMSPTSSKPLCYWDFRNKNTITGLTFYAYTSKKDKTSKSCLVYFDSEYNTYVLHNEDEFQEDINSQALTEGTSIFQQMYTENNQPKVERPPEEMDELSSVDSTVLSQAVKSTFLGPSHALPPPSLLYYAFTSKLINKDVAEEKEDKEMEEEPFVVDAKVSIESSLNDVEENIEHNLEKLQINDEAKSSNLLAYFKSNLSQTPSFRQTQTPPQNPLQSQVQSQKETQTASKEQPPVQSTQKELKTPQKQSQVTQKEPQTPAQSTQKESKTPTQTPQTKSQTPSHKQSKMTQTEPQTPAAEATKKKEPKTPPQPTQKDPQTPQNPQTTKKETKTPTQPQGTQPQTPTQPLKRKPNEATPKGTTKKPRKSNAGDAIPSIKPSQTPKNKH
uniref:WD repeat-containing protein 75 second beta-propeller domain-containing protein n=1 Tax=Arcella intermedia TaxID=1963864 RepID=A0A6B2KXF7_9EUKA